jgi:hypothetical protein
MFWQRLVSVVLHATGSQRAAVHSVLLTLIYAVADLQLVERSVLMPAPGSQSGLAPGAGGTPPSQATPAAVLHFQLLLEAREWHSLALAYTQPWRPLQWYALGLHQHNQRQLEQQRKQLLRSWLASCSPAIPGACVGEWQGLEGVSPLL